MVGYEDLDTPELIGGTITPAIVALSASSVVAATPQEILKEFRRWGRGENRQPSRNPMDEVLYTQRVCRGKAWCSRRRARHDALKAIRQGTTFGGN